MALREKFGRLVLLEETDSGPLGNEYRAARLGPSGFDRLVTVLRFSPAVSGHAEASKRLVEEDPLAATPARPGLAAPAGRGLRRRGQDQGPRLVVRPRRHRAPGSRRARLPR